MAKKSIGWECAKEIFAEYGVDAQKAIDAASAKSAIAADANAKAEAVCHPKFSGWSTAYMTCFLNELAKYPTAKTLPEPDLPEESLYRYSFSSPLWSPDFAGWTIAACGLVIVVIIARLIGLIVLKLLLRKHYREA